MKFTSVALVSVVLLAATRISPSIASAKYGREERRRLRGSNKDNNEEEDPPKRYIVRYNKDHKHDAMVAMAVADEHQKKKGKSPLHINHDFDKLDVMAITATEDEILEIGNNTNIASISLDVPRYLLSSSSSSSPSSKMMIRKQIRKLQSGDDESIPYGVNMVKAPALWEQGFTGQGVKVCVIDSGIDHDHPDFLTENVDGVNTASGWDQDGCGHGTHVTGTISGKDDDKGVIGVAPSVEIFTVRVFGDDCGYTYSSDIFNAAYLCRDNGAHIISMSLGGPDYLDIEEEAFEDLFTNYNILSVAAAGNDGNTDLSYPASYPSVMSVAAIDSDKEHAWFSQHNSEVDIAAPGVEIESTLPVGGCEICDFFDTDGYGFSDGTSMATPHVSAVAALLLSATNSSTSAADLRNAIESTAEDLGSAGRDDFYGFGLIQADAALEYLNEGGDGGSCKDAVGWYDSEGEQFDCAWYEKKDNCKYYGNSYENFGQTASEACCACQDLDQLDDDDSS